MRKTLFTVTTLTAVAVGAQVLPAQEVISSDRPGIGSGASVLGPGTYQLDLNGGWDVDTHDFFVGFGVAVRR